MFVNEINEISFNLSFEEIQKFILEFIAQKEDKFSFKHFSLKFNQIEINFGIIY